MLPRFEGGVHARFLWVNQICIDEGALGFFEDLIIHQHVKLRGVPEQQSYITSRSYIIFLACILISGRIVNPKAISHPEVLSKVSQTSHHRYCLHCSSVHAHQVLPVKVDDIFFSTDWRDMNLWSKHDFQ